MTDQVKEYAYELGFDLVRVATADPLSKTEACLKDRIASGYFDGMDWFSAARAEVACNPRALLPEARSIVSLATFYLTQAERDQTTPGDPHGRISCYAWGDDYHQVIRERLDRIADFMRNYISGPPGKCIAFVDTGRMVDRAVAERSGLGWYGKNTNILTKGWGSWVFLSEIVTSLELEADAPIAANCGQCELCLHACPTNAFVAPYVLDSRRCISYLTIELRGSIPVELRPLIGSHIFGCDICQEVCPVNQLAEKRLLARGWPRQDGGYRPRLEFAPKTEIGSSPALLPLLALDEDEFRRRFNNSPIKRAKRRGLLRNVCVALGNIGDPIAVPALIAALSDKEALVRGHAAWALGRIGGQMARAALVQAQTADQDIAVRDEARYALALCDTQAHGQHRSR
ncbi:MAG: tRNA epoxyqueuosine(34) reductase QueG [Ktedonobacterales bacterium]